MATNKKCWSIFFLVLAVSLGIALKITSESLKAEKKSFRDVNEILDFMKTPGICREKHINFLPNGGQSETLAVLNEAESEAKCISIDGMYNVGYENYVNNVLRNKIGGNCTRVSQTLEMYQNKERRYSCGTTSSGSTKYCYDYDRVWSDRQLSTNMHYSSYDNPEWDFPENMRGEQIELHNSHAHDERLFFLYDIDDDQNTAKIFLSEQLFEIFLKHRQDIPVFQNKQQVCFSQNTAYQIQNEKSKSGQTFTESEAIAKGLDFRTCSDDESIGTYRMRAQCIAPETVPGTKLNLIGMLKTNQTLLTFDGYTSTDVSKDNDEKVLIAVPKSENDAIEKVVSDYQTITSNEKQALIKSREFVQKLLAVLFIIFLVLFGVSLTCKN